MGDAQGLLTKCTAFPQHDPKDGHAIAFLQLQPSTGQKQRSPEAMGGYSLHLPLHALLPHNRGGRDGVYKLPEPRYPCLQLFKTRDKGLPYVIAISGTLAPDRSQAVDRGHQHQKE
jgi:hypothetical protein